MLKKIVVASVLSSVLGIVSLDVEGAVISRQAASRQLRNSLVRALTRYAAEQPAGTQQRESADRAVRNAIGAFERGNRIELDNFELILQDDPGEIGRISNLLAGDSRFPNVNGDARANVLFPGYPQAHERVQQQALESLVNRAHTEFQGFLNQLVGHIRNQLRQEILNAMRDPNNHDYDDIKSAARSWNQN